MTVLLGAAGWIASGPFVATLVVGRTILLFPSIRWTLVALLTWLGLAVAAWLACGPASRNRVHVHRWLAAARSLALLAGAAPLTVLLYLEDGWYHRAAAAPGAPRTTLIAWIVALGLAGCGWRLLVDRGTPTASPANRSGTRVCATATLASLLGPAIMLVANDAILGPLSTRGVPAGVSAPLPGRMGAEPALILVAGAAGAAAVAFLERAWGRRAALAHNPSLLVATIAVTLALLTTVAALWIPQAAPFAAVGVVPLLSDGLWRGRPRLVTATAAALCVLGLAFAGTSREAFSHAATEVLARWPAVATLPWFGAAGIAAGLALLVETERGA